MNSFHSKKKLAKLNITQSMMSAYYGNPVKSQSVNETLPNDLPGDFYSSTRPDYYIFDCRFNGKNCRNNASVKYWERKIAMTGNCVEFDPNKIEHHVNENDAKSSYGYHKSLSLLIGYNRTDWTAGWEDALDGMVLYYNHVVDPVPDPKQALFLYEGLTPIISIQQLRTKYIGKPY
ncbi:unnamed protein product, partial [Oikopleura dioica]